MKQIFPRLGAITIISLFTACGHIQNSALHTDIPLKAQALEYRVTNGNDDGPGSLRESIRIAEQESPNELVTIIIDQAVKEIKLEGQIILNEGMKLEIKGKRGDSLAIAENNNTVISGEQKGRVFNLRSNSYLKLSYVDITNGFFGSRNKEILGAGIFIEKAGELEMDFVKMYNNINRKNHGGAIYSRGILNANDCEFFDNLTRLEGGAIYSNGTKLNINRAIFDTNIAQKGAGVVIYNPNGEHIIKNSVFTRNKARKIGGSIHLTLLTGNIDPQLIDNTILNNIVEENSNGTVSKIVDDTIVKLIKE